MSSRALGIGILASVLALATTAGGRAVTTSVIPAQPFEGEPITLVLGLTGSCPMATNVRPGPAAGQIRVTLQDLCPGPQSPQVLEVPIGPLVPGNWELVVENGRGQLEQRVTVKPVFYDIDFDPAEPTAGSQVKIRFSGTAECPRSLSLAQDGNLFSLLLEEGCQVLPLGPPERFLFEQTTGPLAAGDYAVRFLNIASRRLHVFGPQECKPAETALCLQQGRFRVEATWRTGAASGKAQAHPQTADSGALWFFNAKNLEVVTKVLDACQSPSKKFWVFAAGLTDVEVELTVTDVPGNRSKTYRTPGGAPFQPILDTAAFDCP